MNMRKIVFLAVGMMAVLSSFSAETPKRMNVLFVSVDDLNDYISPMGGFPGVKTPNFDRLAEMGVMFSNAHASSPVCGPSRCAIMTGRQPFVTGVYKNRIDEQAVVKKTGSLNLEFLQNGYYVAGAGKIYHRFAYIKEDWSEILTDHKWPKLNPADVQDYAGGFRKVGAYPKGTEEKTADYQSASWAIERLLAPRDKPFFIACGIYRPHVPWNVPKKYFDQFPLESIELPDYINTTNDLDDIPEFGRQLARQGFDSGKAVRRYENSQHAAIARAGQAKELIRAYLACIAYADAQLGRILDAYEKSPERDHTILALWSDHGWHLGEKAHWRKATLWEEATRVPFFMVIPGVTKPGSRIDRPVSLIDIYPTLRDYCELQSERKLCGDSLRPLFDSSGKAEWRDYAFTVYREKSIAVRTPYYRLIRYPDDGEEFYDHRNDPRERVNLINNPEYMDAIRKTRRLLPVEKEMADQLPDQKKKKR